MNYAQVIAANDLLTELEALDELMQSIRNKPLSIVAGNVSLDAEQATRMKPKIIDVLMIERTDLVTKLRELGVTEDKAALLKE